MSNPLGEMRRLPLLALALACAAAALPASADPVTIDEGSEDLIVSRSACAVWEAPSGARVDVCGVVYDNEADGTWDDSEYGALRRDCADCPTSGVSGPSGPDDVVVDLDAGTASITVVDGGCTIDLSFTFGDVERTNDSDVLILRAPELHGDEVRAYHTYDDRHAAAEADAVGEVCGWTEVAGTSTRAQVREVVLNDRYTALRVGNLPA